MDAAISGQLGRAFLIDGTDYRVVTTSTPELTKPATEEDFGRLYRGAQDLEYLENSSLEDIKNRLNKASEEQDVLTVATLLMDGSASVELRQMAAETLRIYLSEEQNCQFLRAVLFSEPLGLGADLQTVSSLLTPDHPGQKLFDLLNKSRRSIRRVVTAWDAVPHDAFHGNLEKALAARTQIQSRLVRHGWFFKIVKASQNTLQLRRIRRHLLQQLSGPCTTMGRTASLLDNWFRPLFSHARGYRNRLVKTKSWESSNLLEVREPVNAWRPRSSTSGARKKKVGTKPPLIQDGRMVSSATVLLKLRHLEIFRNR